VGGSSNDGSGPQTAQAQAQNSYNAIVLHAIGLMAMRLCSRAGGQLIHQYPTWSESLHQEVMSEADYLFGEHDRARALRLVTRIEQADPAYFPIVAPTK